MTSGSVNQIFSVSDEWHVTNGLDDYYFFMKLSNSVGVVDKNLWKEGKGSQSVAILCTAQQCPQWERFCAHHNPDLWPGDSNATAQPPPCNQCVQLFFLILRVPRSVLLHQGSVWHLMDALGWKALILTHHGEGQNKSYQNHWYNSHKQTIIMRMFTQLYWDPHTNNHRHWSANIQIFCWLCMVWGNRKSALARTIVHFHSSR